MDDGEPSDRNGEPSEMDWGCIIMGSLIAAMGLVTAAIVLFSTR